MARKVFIHPGTLYCGNCLHELQPEHGALTPTILQWVYACTFTGCPQVGERLAVPLKSMVVLDAT